MKPFGWVEDWSLITLRKKLIKIGGKVVRHCRYITFRVAEVAIPRPLFAEILHLIDVLRPRPPARSFTGAWNHVG